MAIAFIQQRKKQSYLIIALVIAVLLVFVILWQGFLKEKKPISVLLAIPEIAVSGYPKIEINFGILEKPEIKEFTPFEKISPFEEQAGRENPFLPY